jgi:hypothetical protein
MEISGVGTYPGDVGSTEPTEPPGDGTEPVVGASGEPVPVEGEPEEDDGQGALRLLQEGHFSGVSDVRLRINFYEELAAIEAEEQKAAAEEQIAILLASVSAGIEPLLGTSEPDGGEEPEGFEAASAVEEEEPADEGGPAEQFAAAVNDAKDKFLVAESPSQEELVGDLTGAFGVLVESLWDLFGPAEEPGGEEPVGGEGAGGVDEGGEGATGFEAVISANEVVPDAPPADEGDGEGEEEEPDAGSYIAELESLFGAALDELISALEGVSILPELSEPNGNGEAYDKFLAIYSELWEVEEEENSGYVA